MGSFPLDATQVFASLALLQDYALNNGTAYAGQVCSVNNGIDVVVYKIKLDKSVEAIDASAGTDFGEFI